MNKSSLSGELVKRLCKRRCIISGIEKLNLKKSESTGNGVESSLNKILHNDLKLNIRKTKNVTWLHPEKKNFPLA